jgi:hypothetical protein
MPDGRLVRLIEPRELQGRQLTVVLTDWKN